MRYRDKRLIGAKREPQTNMMVPRFAYDEAMSQIHATPPNGLVPTRDVSEIRLALKYKPNKTTKKLLSKTAVLNVDIIDYPGEWLLDLPLLDMDFASWSRTQFDALKGRRLELANPWLEALDSVDLNAEVSEKQLEQVANAYTDYLHACKDSGLHWVQPGRFVLPGELAGAPVLQFFPCRVEEGVKPSKGSNLAMLEARYHEYQQRS